MRASGARAAGGDESTATEVRREASEQLTVLGDLYRPRDAAQAEAYYRRALDFEPEVAGVHARLAAALCRLNRFGEAEEHLGRARLIDPHHDEAACLWAELLVENGKVAEAIACYRSALGNGASGRLRTEYADLLARLGLHDDAEAEYRRVLEREDLVEARVNLGLLLVERARPDAALEQFEHALRLDAGSPEAALNRANALVELGRLADAEAAFGALVEDRELRGAALWGLAAVFARRGDADAAARVQEAAVSAAPLLGRSCAPAHGTQPA